MDSPANLLSSSKQHATQKQTPKCLWSKGISVLSAARKEVAASFSDLIVKKQKLLDQTSTAQITTQTACIHDSKCVFSLTGFSLLLVQPFIKGKESCTLAALAC